MRKILINEQELDLDRLNEYILCDATTISEAFKGVEPFVDLTITSPPYFDALIYSNKKNQVGFNQSYEVYLNDIRKVFQGVYDISKDNSSLYLNIDNLVRSRLKKKDYNEDKKFADIDLGNSNLANYYLTQPFLIKQLRDQGILDIRLDIAEILFDIGWDVRAIIIWDKCKTLPLAKKCTPGKIYRHEYILYAVKGECGKFNENYRRLPNGEYKGPYVHYSSTPAFWEHNDVFLEDRTDAWLKNPEDYDPYGEQSDTHIRFLIPTQNKYTFKHPCPFPPKLIAHFIKTSTIDGTEVIFDPFGGTGITKAVANEMGYKALTLDISSESRKMHYEEIIPYVKKKYTDIKKYFDEQEELLPLYTKSIFELQVTKFLTMVTNAINLNTTIPNVLLYANSYNTDIPVEGEKLKVNLMVGLCDISEKTKVEEFINDFYEYLGPGYFEFNLHFINKEDIISKILCSDEDLAIYINGHLNPLIVNPTIDDTVSNILNGPSVFCSNIIIDKNKYKCLLPQKHWR